VKFISPSWDEVYDLCIKVAEQVRASGNIPDILVGVARGGLAPARVIADLLELRRVEVVQCESYDYIERNAKPKVGEFPRELVQGQKVLLVDDVADTGGSIIAINERFESFNPDWMGIAVLYKKPWNKATIDYFAAETDAWIIFPWERLEAIKTFVGKGFSQDDLAKTSLPASVISKLLTLSAIQKQSRAK
jgi:hypoxanthine phosphoribosyltransferase